jgi:hypothetical protein
MKPNLSILHQNIQSIGNNLIEVDLALKSDLKDIDVLFHTALVKRGIPKINSYRSVGNSELR